MAKGKYCVTPYQSGWKVTNAVTGKNKGVFRGSAGNAAAKELMAKLNKPSPPKKKAKKK